MGLGLCSETAATGTGLTCLSEAVVEEDGYFFTVPGIKRGQLCHLSTLQNSQEGTINVMLM